MAILFVDPTFNTGVQTSADDKGWITATANREFNVFVDNVQGDNEITVRLDPRIPRERDVHPYFPYLICDSVDCTRQGPRHFIVAATYKSAPYKDQDNPESPLSQPTEISYFTITNEGGVETDINGKPIVTACGEPIYGVTRAYSDLGIRLRKNFSTFDPPTFYLFINTVNSDTFLGFPPGTLWISNITADEQFYEEVPYWSVQVEINARKPYQTTNQKAWWARYRHQGFRSFQQVNGNWIPLKVTRGGEPVSSPVLLDAVGKEIPETYGQEMTAYWLESQIYETSNFSSMGF